MRRFKRDLREALSLTFHESRIGGESLLTKLYRRWKMQDSQKLVDRSVGKKQSMLLTMFGIILVGPMAIMAVALSALWWLLGKLTSAVVQGWMAIFFMFVGEVRPTAKKRARKL